MKTKPLFFKLDSLDEEIYKNIVRVKRSFNQLMNGLYKIYKKGFTNTTDFADNTKLTRVAFSAVIFKQNFNELPILKEYAHSHNA
ncbi:hypothetical protein ACETAC_01895 [Aceticella autotrophica]|uniref:Uncharacterized protein n=1 Tax=Aceticella autotrophica TaxID=2755338 RepID=A0A975AWI4_9THEO|nr:hypothetical protein [Aceticella autotrophica]QSZ27681.1 hypothetical protein ACETAC_01895 [Aceticella autotrophica]